MFRCTIVQKSLSYTEFDGDNETRRTIMRGWDDNVGVFIWVIYRNCVGFKRLPNDEPIRKRKEAGNVYVGWMISWLFSTLPITSELYN